MPDDSPEPIDANPARARRRWAAWVVTAVKLLLIGAGLSVLVAWGRFAFHFTRDPISEVRVVGVTEGFYKIERSRAWGMTEDLVEHNVWEAIGWNGDYEMDEETSHRLQLQYAIEWAKECASDPAHGQIYSDAVDVVLVRPEERTKDVPFRVVRSGWPAPALMMRSEFFTQMEPWGGPPPWIGIRTPFGRLTQPSFDGVLPYIPTRGLLIDTVFWAVVWAGASRLAISLLRRTRGAVRRRGGLCPHCGYPQGPGARCPECGTQTPPFQAAHSPSRSN